MGTGKTTNLCKIIEKYSKSAKKMKKCAKKKKPPPRCSDSGWFVGSGLDRSVPAGGTGKHPGER